MASNYYSIDSHDPAVYHDKENCPDGKQILPENRRLGTGGHPHCKECPKVKD